MHTRHEVGVDVGLDGIRNAHALLGRELQIGLDVSPWIDDGGDASLRIADDVRDLGDARRVD